MKKVLSLVLAAAMAMGVTATAFAASMTNTAEKKQDTTFAKTPTGIGISVSEIRRTGDFDDNMNIPYGKKGVVRYAVTATSNKYAYGDSTKAEIILNVHSFDNTVRVKGPADVSDPDVDRDTFKWNYSDDNKYMTVYYEFDVEIKPTDEASVAPKGIVLDVTAKPSSLAPSGTGLRAKDAPTIKDITVGYNNIDIDDMYDTVVDAFDEMNAYAENSFEVNMNDNPVLPASVVKFLAKNLGSKQSAIFVTTSNASSPVYFDGVHTLELSKAAFNDFPANKHINIATNSESVEEINDALDEAGIDYKWYNYVVYRDIEATHSLETRFDTPTVYLVNEDGSLSPIDAKDTEDYAYGDVVFTGPMAHYLITEGAIPEDLFADDTTDEPIEDDDLIDEPTEDDDNLVDEDGNPIENNPGTGSSNAISLAVAMAVVSLAAAGLVASKKASK